MTSLEEDFSEKQYDIFPNPFNEIIEVNSNSYPATLQIYNLNGRLILEKNIDRKTDVNLSEITNPGVYHLKLTTSNAVNTLKIIKK